MHVLSRVFFSPNQTPIMLFATWQRAISARPRPELWRTYTQSAASGKSAHAHWYSDLLPGMIPVALLGSAVYLGLQLIRENLAHEKYLDEARARVKELEAEVSELRAAKQKPAVPLSGRPGWFRWL